MRSFGETMVLAEMQADKKLTLEGVVRNG